MKQILQHKNLFQFTQELFHKLSREDQLKISPTGTFVDSPYLISRLLDFSSHHVLTSFAEAYKLNGISNNVAFVVIAVLPEWRNQGIGSALLQQMIEDLTKKGYRKVIYRTSIDNDKSIALAKSNGFKEQNRSKTTITFYKQL